MINMNINYIYPNNITTPNFQGNRRIIKDNTGKELYKTTTYLFRSDLNWNSFTKLLLDKYKNTPDVKIICHACSNGAEAYSLAAKLLLEAKDHTKKFFPILAKDLDKENLRLAREGYIGVQNIEMYNINAETNFKTDIFFKYIKPRNYEDDIALQPKVELKDKIVFEQGNILEDIDKIDGKNTVVMCRNFWPYLDKEKQHLLAQKLSQKLDESSLLVIGSYDSVYGIDALLHKNGFIQTKTKNVYTRAANLTSANYNSVLNLVLSKK